MAVSDTNVVLESYSIYNELAPVRTADGGSPVADADGNGAHIGLANVRSRLADQCGGTLLIRSMENGTTVNIWIPKT